MNLRNSPEQPIKLDPIESRHRLTRFGHLYGCRCGNIFLRASTMRDAEMYLRHHQQVVKGYESGDTHDQLADEGDNPTPQYPRQGIWQR